MFDGPALIFDSVLFDGLNIFATTKYFYKPWGSSYC